MVNIPRLLRRLGWPGFATVPYLIDRKTDAKLISMGRAARSRLEEFPLAERKKVLYFLGYEHSKFVALNDATMIMALQMRGAEVIPVVSGFFYQKEDVIYGGVYNDHRFDRQYTYSRNELFLTGVILNADPVSLTAFADRSTEIDARSVAEAATFSGWRDLRYEGFAVGEMAEKLVSNMNNIPAMQDTPEHLAQLRWQIYNVVRLIGASRNLIRTVSPDAIVSNAPFYYRWRIPYLVAQERNVPFYSYALGERKNTLAWASDTAKIFDSSPAWESFRDSGIYEQYRSVVERGIEDRIHGRISHIPFLPGKNEKHKRVNELRATINGRPAVLFPVNVLVDAAVFVPTQAFTSCMDMITAVVNYFRNHPEFVCILKAHPGESVWKNTGTDVSSMHLRSALANSGITLPENVLFIDYDEEMSSFNLYEFVRGLIAYSSSTCMEISWFGKRVITAHDAHYCCAGFAYHPKSRVDFFSELEDILQSGKAEFDPDIERLGRIYYLLYYYVCQVDCKLVEGNDLETIPARLLYEDVESLSPGRNAALDYVCDAILNGTPIFGDYRWPPVTV